MPGVFQFVDLGLHLVQDMFDLIGGDVMFLGDVFQGHLEVSLVFLEEETLVLKTLQLLAVVLALAPLLLVDLDLFLEKLAPLALHAFVVL